MCEYLSSKKGGLRFFLFPVLSAEHNMLEEANGG